MHLLSVWKQALVANATLHPEGNNCLLCQSEFNAFNRKHHCRQCEQLVCGDCWLAPGCSHAKHKSAGRIMPF